MENRTLFITFLALWLPYVVGLHAYAYRRRLGQGIVMLSHAAPSLVAVTMAYIFKTRPHGGGAEGSAPWESLQNPSVPSYARASVRKAAGVVARCFVKIRVK